MDIAPTQPDAANGPPRPSSQAATQPGRLPRTTSNTTFRALTARYRTDRKTAGATPAPGAVRPRHLLTPLQHASTRSPACEERPRQTSALMAREARRISWPETRVGKQQPAGRGSLCWRPDRGQKEAASQKRREAAKYGLLQLLPSLCNPMCYITRINPVARPRAPRVQAQPCAGCFAHPAWGSRHRPRNT
jgi:hypothetical protein